MKRAHLLWIPGLLALLTASALAQPATAPGHTVLDADLEPLRFDFNEHAGKLRAVLLVAPT